jgi:enamine deaminase RidA (YjgF/YER057c/UK114 family)
MSGKSEAETPAQRLAAMGIVLPAAPAAVGAYAAYILDGGMLVVSGQLSRAADGNLTTGHLGRDLNVEQGQAAARLSALNILAQATAALGDLTRIQRTLRLNGFMQADPAFADHAKVMNGASDLIAAVLGPAGVHSRVAVGAASLPLGAATEIDALFAVDP